MHEYMYILCLILCLVNLFVPHDAPGRGGNVWESPAGCLMFSFKASTRQAPQLAFLQYLISLAVVDAVGELTCIPRDVAQV